MQINFLLAKYQQEQDVFVKHYALDSNSPKKLYLA